MSDNTSILTKEALRQNLKALSEIDFGTHADWHKDFISRTAEQATKEIERLEKENQTLDKALNTMILMEEKRQFKTVGGN